MIGSVGNNCMMSMMQQMQGMGGRTGTLPKMDQDGSGGLNKSELGEVASTFETMTGQSINVEEALANFDGDGNGELSQEEFKGYMKEQGFAPPQPPMMSTDMLLALQGDQAPSFMNQSYSAYGQTSGDDLLSELLNTLSGDDDEQTGVDCSV